MTDFQVTQALITTRREYIKARNAVLAWMDEQGKLGNLVYNNQAPAWPAYEAASNEWTGAVNLLDGWIAKL